MVRRAPLRDPVIFRVGDYEIALRAAQARCIHVELRAVERRTTHHCGGGTRRDRPRRADPLRRRRQPQLRQDHPVQRPDRAARQDRQLPGRHRRPLRGPVRLGEHETVVVEDLPGTYSLDPISPDEQIVVDVLDTDHHNTRVDVPDAMLVTLNATTLRRSLGLLAQLQQTGLPICVVLTFTDDLARRQREARHPGVHPGPRRSGRDGGGRTSRRRGRLCATAMADHRSWTTPVVPPPDRPRRGDRAGWTRCWRPPDYQPARGRPPHPSHRLGAAAPGGGHRDLPADDVRLLPDDLHRRRAAAGPASGRSSAGSADSSPPTSTSAGCRLSCPRRSSAASAACWCSCRRSSCCSS